MGTRSDTVAGVQLTGGAITGAGGILTSLSNFDVRSGSISAILDGAVTLEKTTGGTVTISATNTYTGATNVIAGTLVVLASQNMSALNISDGAEVVFGDGLPFAPEPGKGDGFSALGGPSAGVVPEPGSVGLLLIGALGLLARRRRA